MTTTHYKRRRRLIKPRLQLKLIGAFAGMSALGFLLQYILLAKELSDLALAMPEGGEILAAKAFGLLLGVLGVSFGLLFPLTLAVGVVLTFRIAGPIYRFERYLEGIARGEEIAPCSIRHDDELHELCDRINSAVRFLSAERTPHEQTNGLRAAG